jgi:hypothetical protein
MAQFVKLSGKWINIDRVGAVEDDGTTVRLHADLDAGHGRISRGFTGEDAETLRGALNALSVNVGFGGRRAQPLSAEELRQAIAEAVAVDVNRSTPRTEEIEGRG